MEGFVNCDRRSVGYRAGGGLTDVFPSPSTSSQLQRGRTYTVTAGQGSVADGSRCGTEFTNDGVRQFGSKFALSTYGCDQPYSVAVLLVGATSYPLQVANVIVGLDPIAVIDLMSWSRAGFEKCLCDEYMHAFGSDYGSDAQGDYRIVSPSVGQVDREDSANTCALAGLGSADASEVRDVVKTVGASNRAPLFDIVERRLHHAELGPPCGVAAYCTKEVR